MNVNDLEAEDLTEAPPETFTWQVWRDRRAGYHDMQRHIMERVGEIESDSQWSPWPGSGEDAALALICRLGEGAGDYVLICDDRVQRVSIVADTVYRRADQ